MVSAARPRPALHFAPARGWMSDPNGLVQWNGRVHLFYQHNPSAPVWANMVWGHASTADLRNWEDHPPALEPDPAGPDRDGCFSGCAVVADGKPRLLYTGVRGAAERPCLAEAADRDLTRWTRHAGNPVIASPPAGLAVRAFRDHSAWRADSMWYQVVGGGLEDRGGALFLYRSKDLRSWQYVGVFATAAGCGLAGTVWECPDVFSLGGRVVIVVSVDDGGPQYAMWMTGEVTGHKFTVRAAGRCDGADRYYAPQSLTLADGRRMAFGWLRESLAELPAADASRVGVMSLPRELRVDEAGALRSWPARELDRARRQALASQLIHGRGTVAVPLSARAGHAAEISVTPVSGAPAAIVLRLAGQGCADVRVRVAADGVTVTEGNRTLTAAAPAPRGGRLDGQAGEVRLYYDQGIVEVYSRYTTPAAVICDQRGAYSGIEVDVVGPAAGPCCTATLAVWSCGRA